MASISQYCSRNCSFAPTAALPKALSLIPVIGTIIAMVEVTMIGIKLKRHEHGIEPLSNRAVKELTKSKNHYNIMSASSGVLVLATAITLLALGIINPVLGGIWLGLIGLSLAFAAYKLHQDIQAYNRLPDN